MINFVIHEQKESSQTAKARKLVRGVTTGILAAYILGLAGLFAWQYFLNRQEEEASEEVLTLTTQITSLSEEEVMARQLEDRSRAVLEFLDSRGQMEEEIKVLTGAGQGAQEWTYLPDGMQTVRIFSAGPGEIKNYADYLAGHYENVRIQSVKWSQELGWEGLIDYKGRKKT